jgi:Ca-activated chloride channel family protein
MTMASRRSRLLVPSVILSVLAGTVPAASGGGAGAQEEGEGPYFEQVTVRLVLLQATVLNRRGETVQGLEPDDFQVRENGVDQEVAVFGTARSQPLKIAFLLDISGSMSLGGRLDRARGVIRDFVEALRPEDQVALLVFADGDVAVEMEFTTDRVLFHQALGRQEAFGRTALRDALAYAPRLLAEARPGRKALIMVTDGVDNASEMTTFRALRLARQVQVPIYAIGMTGLPEERRVRVRPSHGGRTFLEVMREFSDETGGRLFPVFDGDDVHRAVTTVKRHLQGQYVIGYHPAGTGDGPGFRQVELMTTDPRLRVQTRRGYYVKD